MPQPASRRGHDPGDGVFGVMLRCIGWAAVGAVRVVGGADQVMLPRLPDELPPPARASAKPGASARLSAATVASRYDVRRMAFSRSLRLHAGNMVMRRLRRQPSSCRRRARSANRCRGGIAGRWPASGAANISIRLPAMVISADRLGQRAVADHEAGGAAAVVAGDAVHPHADQLGDIEAVLMSAISSAGVSVPAARYRLVGEGEGGPPVPRAAWPVERMPSCRAERQSSSQVVSTPSSIDGAAAGRHALAVERAGERSPRTPARVVADRDARAPKMRWPSLSFRKDGAARHRGAVDRARQMAEQAAGDARVVDHRQLRGLRPASG